jgi:dsDNA-specific endonuclease/ATPase MutS2
MADETIIADEQTQEIDESNDLDLDEEEVDATISETDEEKELLKQQLAKAEADKEKWEARYKSTKKQEASKPKETKQETKTDEVNLDELVEKKLTAMQEQKDFIAEFGEDVFEEVKKIKDKHPTLSLKDAYKLSPIASDPASKENPSALSM